MEEKPSSSSARDLKMRRLGSALQNLMRNVESAREAAARAQKLHPTDFSCIGLLARAGAPISPKQIIDELHLSSGSGTALLDRLERAGFVRRLPNPDDRRSVLIELDKQQAAEPLARYREIEQAYVRVTENLTDKDMDTVADFLDGVAALTRLHPRP